MPKLTKKTDDGRTVTVDTELPREVADLKARGFREAKAPANVPTVAKPGNK